MSLSQVFDYIIVGGGIAGSTFSNLMSRKGYSVLVIEKDKFPKHKVCGEYVSNESYDFMQRIGIPLDGLELPKINRFRLSNIKGKTFETSLDLGGFGISRYLMDNELKKASIQSGSHWVVDHVSSFSLEKGCYEVNTKNGRYLGKNLIGAWGKRSNLDRSMNRPFYTNEKSRLTNWVGIKYHIRSDQTEDLISLHTFKNGYCGISKIEDDKYCLCYLMRGENLKGRTIREAEEEHLFKNPFLKDIFNNAEFIYDQPLAISQVNFQKRSKVMQGITMLGDSAGLIAPLCGNGMSMAMHSALLASEAGSKQSYPVQWEKEFKERTNLGRFVQYIFGRNSLMIFFITLAKTFPAMAKWMIRKSHGKPF